MFFPKPTQLINGRAGQNPQKQILWEAEDFPLRRLDNILAGARGFSQQGGNWSIKSLLIIMFCKFKAL